MPQLTAAAAVCARTSLTLLAKVILFSDFSLSQIPIFLKISSEYCPTGTSELPRAMSFTLSVTTSPKLRMFVAFLPFGTMRTTLLATMLKRVPGITNLSLIAFICFCPAEMKMSHSAPCSICVLSVPLESKL